MKSSYKEAVDWLFQQFANYQNSGAVAYKPGFQNVEKLIEVFELDYSKLKYVHVAGTNGKGSTCAFIASALTESGEKVGLFSSPHIVDFSERIRINGQVISEKEVIDFVTKIKTSSFDFSPSFFELTFVMALKHFLENECTIVVLETGLGGRLDATNIVTPLVAVITTIGLDHQYLLGETRSEIAFEKAGIIKPTIPVVIGELDEETVDVFKKKAEEVKAPIYFVEEQFDDYIQQNKAIAFKALSLLKEHNFYINEETFVRGCNNVYKNTGLIGRMQIVSQDPLTIIDAAHNEDGIKSLIGLIKNRYPNYTVNVVFGSSNDKNHDLIFKLFPKDWNYYFTTFSNQRSLTLDRLKDLSNKFNLSSVFFDNPTKALLASQDVVKQDVVTVCFGSFFMLENFY